MKQTRYATIATAALAAIVFAMPAHAADNVMKVCGAKYQAAKTAKTLPAGQTWNQFLASCRAGLKPAAVTPAPAPVAKPAPVARAAPVVKPAGTRTQSPGQAAMVARERQCGAQWKADKAAGKIPAGQTWPQYWSLCNKRLKG